MKATLVVLALSLTTMACSHHAKKPDLSTNSLTSKELTLVEYRSSVPGRFLMTGALPGENPQAKERPSAFWLSTDGSSGVLKSAESRYRELTFMDVRAVEPGLYAYVACVPSKVRCFPAMLGFVGADGHDVFPRPIPGERDGLNFHDFARRENGNFVFLFADFDFKSSSLENRIQEWDAEGRKVFNWNMDEHATELAKFGPRSTAHINSIDIDRNGNFLVSVWQFNAVLEVAPPGGKIVSVISSPDWKFANDPYGGFKGQHSVRALSNGNIVMLDNGDGSAGRATRAVEYALDRKTKTATLVWEHRMPNDEPLYRQIGGAVQRLSNGNTLISWGVPASLKASPNMRVATEVDSRGQLVRELKGNHIGFRTWFEESRR